MKRSILLVCFCLTLFHSFSQVINKVSFAQSQSGTTGFENMVKDKEGNLIVSGTYQSSAVICQGDTLSPKTSATNLYLIKFNSSGDRIWMKAIWVNNYYGSQLKDIACDSLGNIYFPLYVGGGQVFFEDTTVTLTGNYSTITKLDANGNHVFTKSVNSSSYNNYLSNAIAVQGNGIFYIENISNIVKLDLEGNFVWRMASNFDISPDNLQLNMLELDPNGNIYANGFFNTSQMYYGTESLPYTGTGTNAFFILKVNPSGQLLWQKGFPARNSVEKIPMTFDKSGNLLTNVVIGNFSVFTVNGETIITEGTNAGLILKINPDGNPLSHWKFLNSSFFTGSIYCDEQDQVFISGQYGLSPSKDILFPGNFKVPQFTFNHVYFAKIDSTGQTQYVLPIWFSGGANFSPHIEKGNDENFYLSGYGIGATNIGCTNYNISPLFSYLVNIRDLKQTAAFSVKNNNDNKFYFEVDSTLQGNSFSWNFGDGSAGSGRNVSHAYSEPGNYAVNLSICNSTTISSLVSMKGLQSVTPNHSANTSSLNMLLRGAGFTNIASVELIRGNFKIEADTFELFNNNEILAHFNFDNDETGYWDMVLNLQNSYSDTLQNAIMLENPTPILLTTEIVSRNKILVNREFPCVIKVTNESNQTVFGVTNFLKFSGLNKDVKLLTELAATNWRSHLLDRITDGVTHIQDAETSKPFITGFYIYPCIGPGESVYLTFLIKSTDSEPFKVSSKLGHSIFSASQVSSFSQGNNNFTPMALQFMAARVTGQPVSNFTNANLSLTSTLSGLSFLRGNNNSQTFYPRLLRTRKGNGTGGGGGGSASPGGPNSGGSVSPPVNGNQEAGGTFGEFFGFSDDLPNRDPGKAAEDKIVDDGKKEGKFKDQKDKADGVGQKTDTDLEKPSKEPEDDETGEEEIADPELEPLFKCPPGEVELYLDNGPDDLPGCSPILGSPPEFNFGAANKTIFSVSSFDPNAIYGPQGYNDANYIANNQTMTYTVTFENMESATANASEVKIDCLLDTTVFDISSFKYMAFGFADSNYVVEPVRENFITEINLQGLYNSILRVDGNKPDKDGRIYLKFSSLDPITRELTDDPDAGFLPPNNSTRRGEGYIMFSVKQKPNLQHGTVLDAQAKIFFDQNEPILTNIHSNTIDIKAPESNISLIELNEQDSTALLKLSALENAGVLFYELSVSVNDEQIFVLKNTAKEDIKMKVKPGNSYKLFIRAKDKVGNLENPHLSQDIVINFSTNGFGNLNKNNFSLYPNPAGSSLSIKGLNEQTTIQIRDITGRILLKGKYNPGSQIELENLSSGVYILEIENQKIRFIKN
ncbi:MAG: PKD domain-containing protein [Bacteroidales bacterium]